MRNARELQRIASRRCEVSVERALDLTNLVAMAFVLVPAGAFNMGSDVSGHGREDDEGPMHSVRICRPFYIGKCPVTQAQYEAVMKNNPSHFKGKSLPVECVSWHDANAFCEELGRIQKAIFRLPTEAEWECACRAGMRTEYCSGNGPDALRRVGWCSYDGNWGSAKQTRPVGELLPNGFGLFDMHGNVWEWCQDWYDTDYYKIRPKTDPSGPPTGTYRVLRGGSWGDDPTKCRSAYRTGSPPDARDFNKGFRVVLEAS